MRSCACTRSARDCRRRADGSFRNLNVRWILYHVLEHQAGHYGQMLLLRHEYRDRKKAK